MPLPEGSEPESPVPENKLKEAKLEDLVLGLAREALHEGQLNLDDPQGPRQEEEEAVRRLRGLFGEK